MNTYSERYNLKPAAAWLRGHAVKTGAPDIDPELLEIPLEVLTDEEYINHNRLAFLLQGKELPKEFAFEDDHPTEKGGEG